MLCPQKCPAVRDVATSKESSGVDAFPLVALHPGNRQGCFASGYEQRKGKYLLLAWGEILYENYLLKELGRSSDWISPWEARNTVST